MQNWLAEFRKWLGRERLQVFVVTGDSRVEVRSCFRVKTFFTTSMSEIKLCCLRKLRTVSKLWCMRYMGNEIYYLNITQYAFITKKERKKTGPLIHVFHCTGNDCEHLDILCNDCRKRYFNESSHEWMKIFAFLHLFLND